MEQQGMDDGTSSSFAPPDDASSDVDFDQVNTGLSINHVCFKKIMKYSKFFQDFGEAISEMEGADSWLKEPLSVDIPMDVQV